MLLATFAARASCRLMFSLLTTSTPRPFSAEVPPSWSLPSLFVSCMANKNVIHCLRGAGPDPTGTHSYLAWPLNDNAPHSTSSISVTSARNWSAHLPSCRSHACTWWWTLLIQTPTHRLTMAWPPARPAGDQRQTGARLAALHAPLDLRPAPPVIWTPGTSPRPAPLTLPGHCGMGAQAGIEGPRQVLRRRGPEAEVCWWPSRGWSPCGAPMALATTCASMTGFLTAMQDNFSCPKPAADGNVRR